MSEHVPPGLPPGAQRLFSTREVLDRDLAASRLQLVTLPLSVYDFMQIVNGLAILEGAQFVQGTHGVALEVQRLQRLLLQEIPFTQPTRDQLQANRKFLELPPL